ncbi:MAG: DUF6172 family protein [Campylobacterota bacterium]|nr:DUF6172 family protein [Campylobacterota bacterium]
MKKVFKLEQENKHRDRVVDSIKNEIRKYLKRERKKKLPDDATYWDFDCSFGKNSDEMATVTTSQIITSLDDANSQNWESCYVEISSKAIFKKNKA